MPNADDREMIDALTTRYVTGELTETVYMVSLHRYLDVDDIRHLVMLHQAAHRHSTPYQKGLVS